MNRAEIDDDASSSEGSVVEQQLNVRVPRTTATSAKRLARRHGMTLNALITKLIDDAVAEEAEEMAQQFDDEQRRANAEFEEMQAYLKKVSRRAETEAARVLKPKRPSKL